jgi:hypothetical protein
MGEPAPQEIKKMKKQKNQRVQKVCTKPSRRCDTPLSTVPRRRRAKDKNVSVGKNHQKPTCETI